MKKHIWMLLVISLLLFTPTAFAAFNHIVTINEIYHGQFYQEETGLYNITKEAAILPASLSCIEESAFEGTAMQAVVIPGAVLTIKDRAFARNDGLIAVSFPESTLEMVGDPFTDSSNVLLRGSIKSSARVWAKRNKYRYLCS